MMKIMIDGDNKTFVNAQDKALAARYHTYDTETGALPFTLQSVEGPLANAVRYGICTQASTPSPSSPVDMVCNCGVITEAMFERRYEDGGQEVVIDPVYVPELLSIHGKNIITDEWEQGSVSSATGDNVTSNYRVRIWVKVNPSTKYTVSIETNTNQQYVWVMQYANDRTYLGSSTSSGAWKSLPYTLTSNANAGWWHITVCKNTGSSTTAISPSDIVSAQIEAGEEATTVGPLAHHTELPPIFGIGDVKDELNIQTGMITRRVKVLILDGSEEWSVVSGSNAFNIIIPNAEAPATLMCSHFAPCEATKTTAQMPDGSVKTHSSSDGYIYFKKNSLNGNISDWVTWLQEQYDAGTPVILLYPLVTAETIPIDYDKLSSYEGTTGIESNSRTSATMDVTYLTL